MKTGAPVNTGYTGGPQYRTQICEAPKLDKKCILNLGTVTGMKNATAASGNKHKHQDFCSVHCVIDRLVRVFQK